MVSDVDSACFRYLLSQHKETPREYQLMCFQADRDLRTSLVYSDLAFVEATPRSG